MRTAYFDCFAGVSGDMILGALIDAGLDPALLQRELVKLPLEGYGIAAEKVVRGGVAGTRFIVTVNGRHKQRGLADILAIIDTSTLADGVRRHASDIFRALAAVEAAAHGVPIELVHFHEIGAVDSIIDIVGACIALDLMGIGEVRASAVNTGGGFVDTEHGRLPVPAPATAALLRGVPVFSDGTGAELATPTGAAVLTHFAAGYGPLPSMTVGRIGYGAGTRDLPIPNLLRVFLGVEDAPVRRDVVLTMETTIDDMSPEWYQHLAERLMEAGALDVYTAPVIMKKSRPGVQLTVIARPDARDELAGIIFAESTTAGIRLAESERLVLDRETVTAETRFGPVPVKVLRHRGAIVTIAPEYEACRRLARERGVPLKEVFDAAHGAARAARGDGPDA